MQNVECVSGGVFECGIAGGGGQADELDAWVVCGVEDGEGVVEAWVAVEPDGYLLLGRVHKLKR